MASALDEALEILRGCAFEYGRLHLSNHGPMVAEALCAMDRGDEAINWVVSYRRRLRPRPAARSRIRSDDWRNALGDLKRGSDWIEFFTRELAEAPWKQVLNRWVPELAPGMIGAAFHGVIRTGHAVRAIAVEETPARRDELAQALAYWAASYSALPEANAPAGGWLPSEAIASLELIPRGQRGSGATIVERLKPIRGFKPFQLAAALVDSTKDATRFVADLTETFARVYLANAGDIGSVITFVHSVTGPAAVGLMAPHLSPPALNPALRYSWQGAAALFVTLGHRRPVEVVSEVPSESAAELVAEAVDSGDEHAIKFTEACLRQFAVNPKPAYIAAAHHANAKLGGLTNKVRTFAARAGL